MQEIFTPNVVGKLFKRKKKYLNIDFAIQSRLQFVMTGGSIVKTVT